MREPWSGHQKDNNVWYVDDQVLEISGWGKGKHYNHYFCLGTEVLRLSAEGILSDTVYTSAGKETCAQS